MSDLPEAFVNVDTADAVEPGWLWPGAPRDAAVLARMSWLDENGVRDAALRITGVDHRVIVEVASVCERAQIDAAMWEDEDDGALVVIAGAASADRLPHLREISERVIVWRHTGLRLDPPGATHAHDANTLIETVARLGTETIELEPRCETLRVRRYRVEAEQWLVVYNESDDPLDCVATLSRQGERSAIDLYSGQAFSLGQTVRLMLPPHQMAVLRVEPD